MRTSTIDYYSPEAVEMVMAQYVQDLDRLRSGRPFRMIDLTTPQGRNEIRMLRIYLSPAEIAETYHISLDVVRVIVNSAKEQVQ